MCKSLKYATELFDTISIIKNEWENLANELSETDKKILDVEHYIEISKSLNAAQGYNAYKLLKDVLEERRHIKDQIDEMRPLMRTIQQSNLNEQKAMGSLYQSIKDRNRISKNEAENRKYNVRVLTEIFGETIQAI